MIFLPWEKQTFAVMHKTKSQFNNKIRSNFFYSVFFPVFIYIYILFRIWRNSIYIKSDFHKEIWQKDPFLSLVFQENWSSTIRFWRKKEKYSSSNKKHFLFYCLQEERFSIDKFSFLAIVFLYSTYFWKCFFIFLSQRIFRFNTPECIVLSMLLQICFFKFLFLMWVFCI